MQTSRFRGRVTNAVLALSVALALFAAVGLPMHRDAAPVSAQGAGTIYREVPLDTANVITADEATSASTGWAEADLIGVFLTCTEDSGTASLDATVQGTLDGTNWRTLVAFTQLTATGSETKLYADVRAASAQMIGDRVRLNYDITGTGQYTCSASLAGEG